MLSQASVGKSAGPRRTEPAVARLTPDRRLPAGGASGLSAAVAHAEEGRVLEACPDWNVRPPERRKLAGFIGGAMTGRSGIEEVRERIVELMEGVRTRNCKRTWRGTYSSPARSNCAILR